MITKQIRFDKKCRWKRYLLAMNIQYPRIEDRDVHTKISNQLMEIVVNIIKSIIIIINIIIDT